MRRPLPNIFKKLARSTRGATAIEYGLIVALIALAVVGALKGVAGGSSSLWTNISNTAVEKM